MSRLPASFAKHLKPVRQLAIRPTSAEATSGVDALLKRAKEHHDKGEVNRPNRSVPRFLQGIQATRAPFYWRGRWPKVWRILAWRSSSTKRPWTGTRARRNSYRACLSL